MTSVVRVYPYFDAYYYSYYIQGLYSVFGRRLVFSKRGFPELHGSGLAVIIGEGSHSKNVYICAADASDVDKVALEWCDVYAKANVDPEVVPHRFRQKILPIGPSFGIRIWGLSKAGLNYALSLLAGRGNRYLTREHLANFWRQWKYRRPLSAYSPAPSFDDYVFFVSTLWKSAVKTNQCRAFFIDACRAQPRLTFEGGFPPRARDRLTLEGYMITRRYRPEDYLERTKRSAFVFNTPAVMGCHGWKLGEFLALGKAIISTPLSHPMPAPLIHGENVHFVGESYEEIESAVSLLCQEKTYRYRLERGARRYYLMYLHPTRVIHRILYKCYLDL